MVVKRFIRQTYGIILYQPNPFSSSLQIKTISVVSQKDTETFEPENKGLADYIIVVPENMTKTY